MGGGAGQPPSNPPDRMKPRDPAETEAEAAARRKRAEEEEAKRAEARRKEEDRGGAKPKDGDAGDPTRSQEPPWLVALPEEYRRMITGGDTEHVPPQYRHLVEVYSKWLADHAASAPGR